MNKIIGVILGMFCWLTATSLVQAGGFNLKSIGQLSTEGKQISHWWYSGSSPVLSGEAAAGANVLVKIDGEENTVSADESGNWSYNPGNLADGDHEIVLTSDGSNISFTLTMGAENVDWGSVESGSGEALPAAGTGWPTVVLLVFGVSTIAWAGKNFLIR